MLGLTIIDWVGVRESEYEEVVFRRPAFVGS